MRLFLLVYDRGASHLVRVEEFASEERARADEVRLQLELEAAARGLREDVVILEAASYEDLLRTHGRYFKNLTELVHP